MTQTQTPQAQPSTPAGGKARIGLSDDNPVIGAAVHRDLFSIPPDPAEERRELTSQSRILAMGFFVVFFGIIGGLSILVFNGGRQAGLAVTFPQLPNRELPGWADEKSEVANAEAAEWRERPPVATTTGQGLARPLEHLDFDYTAKDDVDPASVQGLTPIHVWQGRHRVVTGYLKLTEAEAQELKVVLPNLEPQPARSAFQDAVARAKLLRLVPTRYIAGFGLVMGVLGLLVPALLIPFYKFWMRFVTAPLGWFNTRLILGIVWVLMFTPLAVVRRLMGADPLRARPAPKGQSYWLDRNKRDKKHFARGF